MGLKSKLAITCAAVLAVSGGGLALAWARGQGSPTPPAVQIINAGHAAPANAAPQQVQPTTPAPTTTAPATTAPASHTPAAQADADDAAPDNETGANETETGASETETDVHNDAGAQDDDKCPPNCDAASGEKD